MNPLRTAIIAAIFCMCCSHDGMYVYYRGNDLVISLNKDKRVEFREVHSQRQKTNSFKESVDYILKTLSCQMHDIHMIFYKGIEQ